MRVVRWPQTGLAIFWCLLTGALLVSTPGLSAITPDADRSADGTAIPSVSAADAECEADERISETFANGARWDLCVEKRIPENLVLRHVTFTPDGGEPWPVLASASLAQLHVAYDDSDVTYNDVTQYGLGGSYLIELDEADCPYGKLLDINTLPAICRWTRTGGDGYRSASLAVETDSLNLFSVSQVGAYAYIQSWTFHDDGAIEPGVGATGALQRVNDDISLPFGRVLDGDPDNLWLSHTHNYHWRLDFDVGAFASDDVVTESRYPVGADGRRVAEHERLDVESARRIDPALLQAWHILASSEANARGYRIEPERHGHRFERTEVEPHTGFDIFVTKTRDCERFASQNARFNPDCLNDVLQYANDEPLIDEDLVFWHRVGFHHVPRNEDQRHMHAHWDGFVIEPVGVNERTPDVRSSTNIPPTLALLPARTNQPGDTLEAETLSADDADGDHLYFQAVNLPPGITLGPDGALSGSATTTGTYAVIVRVDDGQHVAEQAFTWQVGDARSTSGGSTGGGLAGWLLLMALAVIGAIRRRP